jgi:precorrin-2 dehydrogenase/sirohydrochlorin ferrochelatase
VRYYPILLDLRERPCLVVGGGAVAERKAISLFDAAADLTVVSPTLTPALETLAHKNKITYRRKPFDEHDLTGMYLAIAATDDPAVNSAVATACRHKGILVNVAAPPEESTFIVPSVVERGDLLLAVSTCGSSPALSKQVRQDLERTYGPEYAVFLEKLSLLRRRLLHEVADEHVRRKVFQAVVESDVLYLLKGGAAHEADLRIAEIVKAVTAQAGGTTS